MRVCPGSGPGDEVINDNLAPQRRPGEMASDEIYIPACENIPGHKTFVSVVDSKMC